VFNLAEWVNSDILRLHQMRKLRLLFLILTLALGGHLYASADPADAVYRNGYIYTVDAKDSVQQALAVSDGKIVYVGNNAGAKSYIGKHTKVIDLHGKMLMPGLVDGHMHPLQGGSFLLKCNLNYLALTVPQFQSRIQECLDKTKDQEPDGWLEVVNWFQQNMLPSGVTTTTATLDSLKTKRPVIVRSSFGHSTLGNTRALQLAHVTSTTPDPQAGKIWHDSSGNPTGLLEDSAQDVFNEMLPKATDKDNVAAAEASLDAMRKQGITTFLDAAANESIISAYSTVQHAGKLTARAHFAPVIDPKDGADAQKAVAAVLDLKKKYDQGPVIVKPTITVRNAKLFLDGVITAPAFTGAMLQPYIKNAGTAEHPNWQASTDSGPPVYFPAPVLSALLIELANADIEPHMHADGDRAVREGLNGIEAMRARFPDKDIRAAIAHDEIVDPSDYPRYAKLNAIPVLSFQWAKPASDTVDGAKDYLGPARFKIMEPEGLLEAAGARITYGSDWPVDPLDEWFALKVGITRTNAPTAGPKYAGKLGEDPGMSAKTVVYAITINSSYELHQEAQTGSLEPGKLADFIVLDRNLFKIPPEQIANIKVLETVVGGKIVYKAPNFH
jgi:predicted amidohydrolase YtcJ